MLCLCERFSSSQIHFKILDFSDNPLVTNAPRIRFYAGCPIFVGANCVGTLCVLDDRPRQIDAEAVSLLHDLAVLAEMELCRPKRTDE